VNGEKTRVVPAQLSNGGGTIYIEAREVGPPRKQVSSKPEDYQFDRLTDSIESIATRVTDALRNVKPQKATVEFGIDVGVETGGLTGLLARGKGNASLTITIEWEAAGVAGGAGDG
jgi:hypothetical protein